MHAHGLTAPESFPPMRQQPSYAEIMACLDGLRASKLDPMSLDDVGVGDDDESVVWDCATPRDEIEAHQAASSHDVQRYANAVSRYLGSIVMNDLAWLPDEDDREALWTAASRRIAERCGRTAMGDITRRWPLLLPAEEEGGADDSGIGSGDDEIKTPVKQRQIDLVIKEPALVGDSLGFKTWGTSYAMARMLPRLAATPGLRHLQPLLCQGLIPVLELGAGTGLLGLAAAALWRADVVLSDLAAIVPNLAANVERNAKIIQARGGRARAGVLQWGASRDDKDDDEGEEGGGGATVVVDPVLFPQDHLFPLVLAADPIYDEEHPALLASAIDAQLALSNQDGAPKTSVVSPRAVVMVPLRDQQTERMAVMLLAEMAERGLVPVDLGEIAGQDSDWGNGESGGGGGNGGDGAGVGSEFTCAWWVFHRI